MRTIKNGMSKANELLPCFVKARHSLQFTPWWKLEEIVVRSSTMVQLMTAREFLKNNWDDYEKWIGAVAAVADGCDGRSRPGVRNVPARPVPDARPSALGHHLLHHARSSRWAIGEIVLCSSTGPMYFVFCRLYPFPPATTAVFGYYLPVISLLLYNTVSRVRAFLSIWLERFRGSQKEDERGPLIFNSSMV
jgi:hypothetical protein